MHAYCLVFLGVLTVFPLGIALAGDEAEAKTGKATPSIDTKLPQSLAPRLSDHDEPSVPTGKRVLAPKTPAGAGGDADLAGIERAERDINEAQEQQGQEGAKEQLEATREFVKDVKKKIESIQREQKSQKEALDGVDP